MNLSAMNTRGGMTSAAYLVAAKFRPQKRVAEIKETSAITVVLFLSSVIASESTDLARRSHSEVVKQVRNSRSKSLIQRQNWTQAAPKRS